MSKWDGHASLLVRRKNYVEKIRLCGEMEKR